MAKAAQTAKNTGFFNIDDFLLELKMAGNLLPISNKEIKFVAFKQQGNQICCISNSKKVEFSSFRLSNPISSNHRAKGFNLIVRI